MARASTEFKLRRARVRWAKLFFDDTTLADIVPEVKLWLMI